jgi:large subunit ribosomal protein L22
MIRNMPAQRAIATLTFSKRRIAHQVRKTLESAIANAENNHQLDVDRLIVTRAEVGRSIVMRRFHARGRGRSAQIEKWFSHMKIVVAEKQDEVEVDDDVIEGTALPTPVAQATPAMEADHAHTEATLAIPAPEGTEAEAAEQAMSADQAEIADHAMAGEHSPGPGPESMTDHAHTDPTLAIPATEGTEAEAAEQAMSHDQAEAADKAADQTGAADQAETDEHHTPPDHSGQGAT